MTVPESGDWRPEPRRPYTTWPDAVQRPTVVAATGQLPYEVDDLRGAAPADYVWWVHGPLPTGTTIDIVVVGATVWNPGFLLSALQSGHAQTRVLPQDGFLDLILFGRDWWVERPAARLQRAVERQDGIRAAQALVNQWKGLSFAWPDTSGAGDASDRAWSGHLNELSALRERGYQITGKSDDERWDALKRCVADLGLQTVAYFIAFLIRTRRDRASDEVLRAWESDLAKLRASYHLESLRFAWPDA